MTLEDLGNLGELLGALAVVISLVYLAIQIRQNTRAVRSSAEHTVFQSAIDLDRMLVSDRELTRIWNLGRSNPDELNQEEERQFRRLMSMFYRNFENLYLQHENGLVDDRVFATWKTIIIQVSQQPGAIHWWQSYSEVLIEEFRDFVEKGRAA